MLRILRPYGSTEVIEVALRDLTGADYSGTTLASGDVKISKDGAAFGNVANLPTNSSGRVRWTPDTGELNAKSIAFRIKDQTSPAEFIVSDVLIDTYGHASAMHPYIGLAPAAAAPTAAANASAVRVELETELARLDAAVTTRLASGSYTAPPTATAIRNAILAWEPFPSYSLARLLRAIGITLRGTASGMETTSVTMTAPAGGATVTATVDEHGNRSVVSDTASDTP